MKTVAIMNQKGGTGKTTSAINLAGELVRRGKRVLIMDMDTQGNATSNLELSDVPAVTLADVICAIAVHLSTRTVAVRFLTNDLQFACEIVELRLYVGEAVDTADDHCSVLTQTVQDAAERVLTHLVSHLGNLDSTLGGSERLVAGEESEALGLLTEQTGGEVTVTYTYLAVVSHRARDTECLQTDTDSLGSVSGVLAAFLQRDCRTYYIRPFGVLKTNTLGLLAGQIRIEAVLLANLVSLLDGSDTVSVQSGENLFLAAVLRLKFYFTNHSLSSLVFAWVN